MRPVRLLAIYLAVAFGFSWLIGGILFALGPKAPIPARTFLLLVYMCGPALGAIAAQRASGEAVFAPLGASFKANRWWIVAWLLPFALQPLTIGATLLFPAIEWAPDLSGFFERVASTLPPDRLEETKAKMRAIPQVVFWMLLFGQPLIAGITINALAAFGEELGWRGWLCRHFETLGFWRRSAVVGFVWGVWHAPIVMQGHNYPQHRRAGVFAMIAFCLLLAPLHDLVRLRGRSVWAAAILHGTINAVAGISVLFFRGGHDLTIGMTGLPGLCVLALANIVLFVMDRAQRRALTSP